MIIASDLHIRRDRPSERKDDYFASQNTKLDMIFDLTKKSPPLIVGGDFFDVSKVPDYLLQWLIYKIKDFGIPKENIIVVPGQHDLFYHSLNSFNESSLSVLEAAEIITTCNNLRCVPWDDFMFHLCPFGLMPDNDVERGKFNVLVWHNMVIKKQEELWSSQKALVAGKVLRNYKLYDLIITGDNHKTFIEKSGSRFLINTGSMMRMKTNQFDHRPCVFQYEMGKELKQIYLPIEEDVFNDNNYIPDVVDISDFINKLETGYAPGIPFDERLKSWFVENKTKKSVENLIWEAYE